MLEYLLPIVALVFVVVGVLGLRSSGHLSGKTAGRARMQEQPPGDNAKVLSDWHPSGRIDFACPDGLGDESRPGIFSLRVEEYRTLESPSGTTRVELRWRDATLSEAKRVVVHYNRDRRAYLEGKLIPSPSVIPQIDMGEVEERSTGPATVKH